MVCFTPGKINLRPYFLNTEWVFCLFIYLFIYFGLEVYLVHLLTLKIILFYIGVYWIYNIVLVSGVLQTDSVIHLHIPILFQIHFQFRLLQNIRIEFPVLCNRSLLFIYFIYAIFCYRLVAKSCLTVCILIDCSPPGFSVHGIFQARILQWVAISFSRGSF